MIATKLSVPALRTGSVPRPRLLERLARGADARLTLVSGPAGFGKTTLLAAWTRAARGRDEAVGWLSLDRSDNEPASFWSHLVTALQAVVPGVGTSADQLLAGAVPSEVVLTALVNDLAARPGQVWLVLDDYHLLDHPVIRDGMAFVLEHLPPQVHVVLLTRADPDLPLARWRARGELVEVRAVDLRFTTDEVRAYLDAAPGVHLDASDVALLEERTEGWIAALQLVALSLEGRSDVRGFLAGFAGDDRYVVDYLVEEVLSHQTEAVRRFLLQTAVLERLTGPLCDAVTGADDGSAMLAGLERANLFTVALDDRREWYRYHHLFADVLRARLVSEQPAEVALLHDRASHWYERHASAEDAIGHALAAGTYDRAGHLIELAIPAARRHRRDGVVYAWLRLLPEETVRRSPVLSVFYGSMLMDGDDPGAVEARFDDAERALAAAPPGQVPAGADTGELRTLPATIAVYRASLAQARGDARATTEHARRALDLAGPRDHLARGGATGFLGLAAWTEGDVATAVATFGQAVASLHAAGNVVDELTSTVVFADLWLAAGRPSRARRVLEQALQLAAAQGGAVAHATAGLHVALGELDLESGDLDSARQHLVTAAALVEGGAAAMDYRWVLANALLAAAEGELDEAHRLLDRAEQRYRPGFLPEVRPVAALRARLWIGQGSLTPAAAWARERGVSVTDHASFPREFDHLTLVRLVLAQHQVSQHPTSPRMGALDEVAALLARLDEAAVHGGRAASRLEIGLLQGLVRDAQGRRPEAVEILAAALAAAPEPDGDVRLFLAEGAPALGLLRALPPRASEQVGRLLTLAAAAAPEVSAGPLSERELDVLRLLDSELTGPEIARRLFVTPNTLRTHTKHIFTKLDVTSRRSAVRRAHDRGLL